MKRLNMPQRARPAPPCYTIQKVHLAFYLRAATKRCVKAAEIHWTPKILTFVTQVFSGAHSFPYSGIMEPLLGEPLKSFWENTDVVALPLMDGISLERNKSEVWCRFHQGGVVVEQSLDIATGGIGLYVNAAINDLQQAVGLLLKILQEETEGGSDLGFCPMMKCAEMTKSLTLKIRIPRERVPRKAFDRRGRLHHAARVKVWRDCLSTICLSDALLFAHAIGWETTFFLSTDVKTDKSAGVFSLHSTKSFWSNLG